MLNKINARNVQHTIEDKLKTDSKILKDIATFISFGAAVSSGEPLTLAAGLALIVKTAGSTISVGIEIIDRLFNSDKIINSKPLSSFDKFKIIFYVQCQRFYIESIKESLEVTINKDNKIAKIKIEEKNINKYKEQISCQLASLSEAELNFLFCVEPLDGEIPLFNALGRWLETTLNHYGLEPGIVKETIIYCEKNARNRFHVYLAEADETAQWIKNYLAISKSEKVTAAFLNDLNSIKLSLENWTEKHVELQNREKIAWQDYRNDLKKLPDSKETMFNEQFGVRKVFQKPETTYQIIGVTGEVGKPIKTPDTGRLFGALLSTRISGEDLIILCGGPGSGKSTFCRILASQLAQNDSIHPVFLKLRRLKEGADIAKYIEEYLHKIGVISRLADLRDLPNLVIILDGFDELVMASRSRLRQFFNLLREEHSTGPLRRAKIIVSGRDTLFPNGDGLPTGSHVISLLPFDKQRVEAWGNKWREQHQSGPGHTFKPEVLLNADADDKLKKTALHHLVTWPLTLHLVARVHTAGLLDIGGKQSHEVEKAYLYRSILAETANRQVDQTEGLGRLAPQQMREFLRSLSWEMYAQSTDSMDPAEVIPLLAKFYPDASEADMSELADVAVVNSPELAKGEETGFEFVHKSFSEYLIAEKVADCIERVIYRVPGYGSDDLEWRMTDQEAAAELAPVIGLRLLTEEVQEMLEPMLGNLSLFLKGKKANEIVSVEERYKGLTNIIERLEILLCDLLQGKSLDIINKQTQNKRTIKSQLEGYANYCSGILIIGTAAARELQIHQKNCSQSPKIFFNGNKFRGAFWQILSILTAGGINLDKTLANRLFIGMSLKLKVENKDELVRDISLPFKTGLFSQIDGFESILNKSTARSIAALNELQIRERISLILLGILCDVDVVNVIRRVTSGNRHDYWHPEHSDDSYSNNIRYGRYENRNRNHDFNLPEILAKAGLIDEAIIEDHLNYSSKYDRFSEIEHRLFRSDTPRHFVESLHKLSKELEMSSRHPDDQGMSRYLQELVEILVRNLDEKKGIKNRITSFAKSHWGKP